MAANADECDEDFHKIIQMYTTDFNAHQLQVQLQVFSATFPTVHIHKEVTDKLNLIDIANIFIAGNEHRMSVFGTFQASDKYFFVCKLECH